MSKIKQLNVDGYTYDIGIKEVANVSDNGFYIADSNDNVALKYDENGLDAAKVSEHLKNLLGNANYIYNVKDYGAIGDGITDDAQHIQNAINDCNNNGGGIIFFPAGTYALSTALFNASTPGIASALMCYKNQILVGTKNTTLLASGNNVTHIIFNENAFSDGYYNGDGNIIISNLTFKVGNVPVKCTAINITHASNIIVEKCSFYNIPTWHCIEINSSKNCEVRNCYFDSSNNTTEDIQLDAAFGEGNLGANDGTVCTDIKIYNNYFESGSHPSIGNHSDYAHNNIRIYNNIFNGSKRGNPTRGIIDFVAKTNAVDIYNNTFYSSVIGVNMNSTTPTSSVHDNRFVNVTTPHVNCISYNNIVNNTLIK